MNAGPLVNVPDVPIPIAVTAEDHAVTHIVLGRRGTRPPATAVEHQAVNELREYFAGNRRAFDVPVAPRGTPFQLRVWDALRAIPYGATRTYGDVARMVDNPGGSRAVGMANHRNPIPIVIPCHRVVGAGGKLGGFGAGLDVKRRLLRLESRDLALI